MWAVIVLLCILIFSVIALLVMHFDLRDTVEILRSRIDLQNERYEKCLKGWNESNKSVLKVVKLNDVMSKMNRELCDNPECDRTDGFDPERSMNRAEDDM